ncbi:MAG: lysophospholipase [Dehalococcoidales bacterium]|nr:lysophospholipase [Dehalococcoidales bacterium]
MEHREGSFKGQRDLNLYYQCWLPQGKPRAVLAVVHGLAEHGGRYGNLVNHFVPRGYAVYCLDHCGHGKSEGARCYVPRFEDYLSDLGKMIDIIHREQPNNKIFLFGHSMGGMLAVAFAATHQSGLAGLVLSAPTFKVGSGVSPLAQAVAPLLSAVVPKMGVAVLDASSISRDETVVSAYINDPLVYRGKVTARLGAELLKTTQKMTAVLSGVKIPVLIVQGTADRFTDPEGSNAMCRLLGSEDKELKTYEGFYHEVCNEPGHEQVIADIEEWLTARI